MIAKVGDKEYVTSSSLVKRLDRQLKYLKVTAALTFANICLWGIYAYFKRDVIGYYFYHTVIKTIFGG